MKVQINIAYDIRIKEYVDKYRMKPLYTILIVESIITIII